MLPLTIPSPSPLLTPKTLTLKALHLLSKPSFPPKSKTLTLTRPLSTCPLSAATDPTAVELFERDYSFLESPSADHSRVISAAEIGTASRVLLSFPSAEFAGRIAESGSLVVAVHDSLLVLATIKEADDRVRCFQGEIAVVPESLLPFDAVFVRYFPAVGVSVDELLRSVAACCSQGGRLVISFDQGRRTIEHVHRQQYPDLVKYDLPDRAALEKAANDHLFQITEFVDDPTFYLAVLKFHGS